VKLSDLFRTTVVRFALRYTILYLLVVALTLLLFHLTASHYITSDVKTSLHEKLQTLQQVFRSGGRQALLDDLEKQAADNEARLLTLYVDSSGERLAGTLRDWPEEDEISLQGDVQGAWIDMELIPENDYDDDPWLPVVATTLSDGSRLLLSQHVDQARGVHIVTEFLTEVLGASFILALLLSLIMGRQILRRMETISQTAGDIMQGDLSRRIPVSRRNDEFDALAQRLNFMLDRIQLLIRGMREVTDNIAHEMRSPLSRLHSRLEVTLLEERSNQEYRQTLQQGIYDVDHLIHTFNALLSIAQAEAGTHREQWQRIDLSALVQDLAELYEPAAEERQQRLVLELSECSPVLGSRDLLGQAIGNLLENAIKYTPVGGEIRVCVALSAGACVVSVADNGPGIPRSQYKSVLERFVRLQNSSNSSGNGLGLSLVRAVATLHQAELILDDGNPGLVVTLCIPSKVDMLLNMNLESRGC
jgi:signal transduction histidine kinase